MWNIYEPHTRVFRLNVFPFGETFVNFLCNFIWNMCETSIKTFEKTSRGDVRVDFEEQNGVHI